MRCEDLDDLIEAIAAGDPAPAAADAHLAVCARCQARVELARTLDRLLLAREVPVPPASFTQQVMSRISEERWRVEQFVDVGFNLALAAGLLVVAAGATGLLWSLGWLSVDVEAASAAIATLAPWTARLAAEAQTLILAAVLLTSALALWWWVESGGEDAI